MPLAHNREIRICSHEPRRYVDILREFFVDSVHEFTPPIPDTCRRGRKVRPRLTIAFEKQSNSSQPGSSRGSAVLLLVPAFCSCRAKVLLETESNESRHFSVAQFVHRWLSRKYSSRLYRRRLEAGIARKSLNPLRFSFILSCCSKINLD